MAVQSSLRHTKDQPSKRRQISTNRHVAASQNTLMFNIADIKSQNLAQVEFPNNVLRLESYTSLMPTDLVILTLMHHLQNPIELFSLQISPFYVHVTHSL